MIEEIAEVMQDLPFHRRRRNVHSQCGEDGVIEYLLGLSGITSRYFVEFGAWDGRHLSNCAKLADEGWPGCFIEGDPERFSALRAAYSGQTNITTVNAYVETQGNHALDSILERLDAPPELTILSIDIDGMDYHVWASLKEFTPLLCIIEFNPTIPTSVGYIQENDVGINRGCSLRSLWRLAERKGYSLVAATDWNGFFMREDICRAQAIPTYTPEQVKNNRYETFLFAGYDGTLMTTGSRQLLWHGITIRDMELQVLPPELRRFPPTAPPTYLEALARFKEGRGA